MSTARQSSIELVLQLPAELHDEVRDFAEFLLQKRRRLDSQIAMTGAGTVDVAPRRLRQDWAGALAHLETTMNSVDLQHAATDWMGISVVKQTGDDVPR
jgi:hypothetical protein